LNKDKKHSGYVESEYSEDFRRRSDYFGHDHFGKKKDKNGNIDPNQAK
jgi:hypothetical protein